MSEKENLMSGLTIMSPEETMAMGNTEESTSGGTPAEETIENTDDNNDGANASDDDGLTINTPIPNSTNAPAGDDDNGVGDGDNSTDDDVNVFAVFTKELIDSGVISGPEQEEELQELLKDASVDTIKDLMAKTVGKTVEEKQEAWKNGLSDDKKKFLEIESSFNNTDDAIRLAQRINYLEGITNETISNDKKIQSNLYYEDLKLKGFSHEDAVEAIEEADALGKLEAKALKALPSIKKHDEGLVEQNRAKLEADREQFIKDNEAAYNNLMDTIDNKEAFIPGLKLNKVQRDKLKSNMFDSVYEDKQGTKYTSLMYKQMKNPEAFDMMINYYDTLGLFNVDTDGNFKPDISKLKNIAKTKASSELEDVLRRENTKKIGQQNSSTVSPETENVLDFLSNATGHKRKKK